MGKHTRNNDLEAKLWTYVWKDLRFVPDGNAQGLNVLCLMSIDGLGL